MEDTTRPLSSEEFLKSDVIRLYRAETPQEKQLRKAIKHLIGTAPGNLSLYRLATLHTSVAVETRDGFKESNERLEFLGDAVFDIIIAEYLFKKYPYKDEGFLTDIRARIVNRESLNSLAMKIGIDKIAEFAQPKSGKRAYKSIYGNTLEAIIGAIYLDKGFSFTQRFVVKRILIPHLDFEKVVQVNPNYKSKIIEWSQKEGREVSFSIIDTQGEHHHKEFTAQIEIDQKPLCSGNGFSKKKAEQDAAYKACEMLNIP